MDGEILSEDNTAQNMLIGFKTDIGDLLQAELAAGFITKSFKAPGVSDARDINLYANLKYDVTPKLTLGFEASRVNEDDVSIGILKSLYELKADYEIYHNLFLQTRLGYRTLDFDNENIADFDDIVMNGSLSYILSPRWRAGIGADYISRSSDVPNREFDDLQVLINLTRSF